MDTVHQAAVKANAHIFISEMKDQYDTEAGEKGAQLSGANSSIYVNSLFIPDSYGLCVVHDHRVSCYARHLLTYQLPQTGY